MPLVDKSSSESILIEINESNLKSESAGELKTIIKSRLTEGVRDVHLEMRDVVYIDSASIGILLMFIQTLKKDECKIHIDSCSPQLRSLIKSLLLDQFLTLPTESPVGA